MIALWSRLMRRRQPPAAAAAWIGPDALCRQLATSVPPLVVDVRGPDEFEGPLGHIEGALNIPLGDLAARHAELAAADRPIILCCLTDKRSARAAALLLAAGLADIAILHGGIEAWRNAGL
jgi:rhodanese-related sulfurtransferase